MTEVSFYQDIFCVISSQGSFTLIELSICGWVATPRKQVYFVHNAVGSQMGTSISLALVDIKADVIKSVKCVGGKACHQTGRQNKS